MNAGDVIYDEAAPFERALAAAFSDVLPLPIREIMDPVRTPAAFLPFLAAHESVDLWFEDWPEERKRLMIRRALELATLKGTRAAAAAFLAFVDATIIHRRSYPAHKPVGRIAAGITPVQSTAFKATFLLKTELKAPPRSFVACRSAIGHAPVRRIDFSPLRRAELALAVSKSPETAFTVTHAHRVPTTLDDGLDLAAGHVFGSFKDRLRL